MTIVARTPAQVIAGEMVSGSLEQRWRDALAIASVMQNRAMLTGTTIQDIAAVKSQFNAYNSKLPPGASSYVDLAQQALDYVATNGPVNNATYYSTPAAQDNLPTGLQQVDTTAGHVYFSDPSLRSIKTTQGYITPNPAMAITNVPTPYGPNDNPFDAVLNQQMPAYNALPASLTGYANDQAQNAGMLAGAPVKTPSLNNFADLAAAGAPPQYPDLQKTGLLGALFDMAPQQQTATPPAAPVDASATAALGSSPDLSASATAVPSYKTPTVSDWSNIAAAGPMATPIASPMDQLSAGAGNLASGAGLLSNPMQRMGAPVSDWGMLAGAQPVAAPMSVPASADLGTTPGLLASAAAVPGQKMPTLDNWSAVAAADPVQAPEASGINSPEMQAMRENVAQQLAGMKPLGATAHYNSFSDLAAAGPMPVTSTVTPADSNMLASRFAPTIDPTTNTTSFLGNPVTATPTGILGNPAMLAASAVANPSPIASDISQTPGQQAITGILGGLPSYNSGILSAPTIAENSNVTADTGQEFSPMSYAPINTTPTGYNRPYPANQAVSDKVQAAVTSVLGPGANIQVTSGQEGGLSQFGSNRHKTGLAEDITVTDPTGHILSWTDPTDVQVMKDIAQSAATQGANIGLGYPNSPHMMHVDYVDPSSFTPGQDTSWGIIGNEPSFAQDLADARNYGTMPQSYYDAAAQRVVANNITPTINNPFGYTQAQETGGLINSINPVTATPVEKTDIAPATVTSNPMPSYADEMASIAAQQPATTSLPSYDQSLSLPATSVPASTIAATPMSITGQIAGVPQTTGLLGDMPAASTQTVTATPTATPTATTDTQTIAGPANTPAVAQQQNTKLSGAFPAAPAKTGMLGGLINKGTVVGGLLGTLAAGPIGGMLGGLLGNAVNKNGGLTGLLGGQPPSLNQINGGMQNLAGIWGGSYPAGTTATANNGDQVTSMGNGWTTVTNQYGVTTSFGPNQVTASYFGPAISSDSSRTPSGPPGGGGGVGGFGSLL